MNGAAGTQIQYGDARRCGQIAEVAIPRDLFADILRRIDRLRPNPSPA